MSTGSELVYLNPRLVTPCLVKTMTSRHHTLHTGAHKAVLVGEVGGVGVGTWLVGGDSDNTGRF